MRSIAIVAATVVVACTAARNPLPEAQIDQAAPRLAGQYSIPLLTRFPPIVGTLFGGISGLAPSAAPGELLALSDDSEGPRVYRMRVSGEEAAFRAEPLAIIPLEAGGWAPQLDPEAIAVGRNGDLWIASEGLVAAEPRVQPAIARYSATGMFLGQLQLRAHLVPNSTGPIAHGLRGNASLESVTIAPGGGRLFAATETALVQDGEPASFDRGTLARLLEFTADGDSYAPAREFVYPLGPIERVAFAAGGTVKGVVELLALTETDMLSLERTYIEEAARPGQGTNRAEIYRVSIDGATDVSSVGSLRDMPGAVPVRKTLVLDLSTVPGLSPELAPSLDNFEGLALGPRLADGRQSLVMVSDDNFSAQQRTWFLLIGLKGATRLEGEKSPAQTTSLPRSPESQPDFTGR